MRGVREIAGILSLLTLTLWFALCCANSALATTEPSHEAVATEHAVAADAHGEAAGGHAATSSLSAAKIKDLGWRIVNFIALMIILVKFGAKPIGAALSTRRNKIKDEIEDLEEKRAKAEQSYADFQSKLASVESEIDKVVDRAVAQAEVEKAKIIEKAEQAAADIKRSAEQAVLNEISEARKMLKNEVAEQAAVMAQELIVNNLTDDDQVKIIENYLEKVGAVQ
ncbi:ATP synthase F0 subunit B [Desulforhopalus singaporensis]|uniref:ATP synthase subunit b n=1 Tax=Desulforhopalus singaporensis TaxID=91360 RepID=A0A1H0JQN7_9BACT|nr:ATP synthase F0 subunit B [Desulforhopalus singaporensis]SDO45829.1 F-type H+-transporting ATPase subunit b [Desulforhopalus singaporensis]